MSVFHEIDVIGKHILTKIPDIDNETHRGSIDKGRMLYSESDNAVYYGTAEAWVKLPSTYDIFPRSTKILMASYPLPDGFEVWFATSWDQLMIKFTDNLSEVGSVPGIHSWTISGLQSSGKHYHGNKTGGPTITAAIGKSEIYGTIASTTHRHNISNDGEHFHSFDGEWRPVHTHYLPVNYLG
jgi:hypothetical protein